MLRDVTHSSTSLRNSFTVLRTPLSRASRDLCFMFVVCGFDSIVKVWFVFKVLVLEVPGRFWWFSWTILVVPLYLSLCIYHSANRHMMSVHVWALSAFVFIIVLAWHLHPSVFFFLYSAGSKLYLLNCRTTGKTLKITTNLMNDRKHTDYIAWYMLPTRPQSLDGRSRCCVRMVAVQSEDREDSVDGIHSRATCWAPWRWGKIVTCGWIWLSRSLQGRDKTQEKAYKTVEAFENLESIPVDDGGTSSVLTVSNTKVVNSVLYWFIKFLDGMKQKKIVFRCRKTSRCLTLLLTNLYIS